MRLRDSDGTIIQRFMPFRVQASAGSHRFLIPSPLILRAKQGKISEFAPLPSNIYKEVSQRILLLYKLDIVSLTNLDSKV